MDTLQQVQVIYEEWLQRTEANGERAGLARLLLRLLAHRFGEVPPDVAAHIQQASSDTLTLWVERLTTAKFMDDVVGEEREDMDNLQEVQVLYEEWQQRARTDGVRGLLMRLLAQRFGAVPPDAAARIQQASADTLERWVERLLSAQSLDDVFA